MYESIDFQGQLAQFFVFLMNPDNLCDIFGMRFVHFLIGWSFTCLIGPASDTFANHNVKLDVCW